MRDGVAIAAAGAFSLVIEGVAESLAREPTAAVAVPTIGIGGSPACDGQILVIDDMLGLLAEFTPKFVKRYRRLGDEIRAAAREYAEEVRRSVAGIDDRSTSYRPCTTSCTDVAKAGE